MINHSNILKISIIWLLLFAIACSPTIYRPKQNVSLIEGEEKNTKKDDIAPAQQKVAEVYQNSIFDSTNLQFQVMSSSQYVKKLFKEDYDSGDKLRKQTIDNLTRNVESIFFVDSSRGFAAFSHPPSPEFLMGQYLPFDKAELKNTPDNSGGTDIFYFAPTVDTNRRIKFQSFPYLNSPFWDSHPTAIMQKNSEKKPVTLLIFSSDRDNPFSKAINIEGDTIYGGSTDLYYAFGRFESANESDTNNLLAFKFTESYRLDGANTSDFSEGTPFVFCECCNPTLFFSSNRGNKSRFDFDIYAVKLKIDFDRLTVETDGTPEMIDEKSMTTDSLTYSINTIADDRFPFVPYPHTNRDSNNIYFSSDRNKPIEKDCDCEDGRDRTENFGGYDIYKYKLPEKYNCPKEKKIVYSPELYADIVIINAQNPSEKVREAELKLLSEDGKELILYSDSNRIYTQLDFGKRYQVLGGSKYSSMDCENNPDIVFRGYSKPTMFIKEMERDSSTKIELLNSFTMKLTDFVNYDKESTKYSKGTVVSKGQLLSSDVKTIEKVVNARIEGEIVIFDKQITYTNYWNKIDIVPNFGYLDDDLEGTVQNIAVPSIRTYNDELYRAMPESNERIIIRDTVYLLPDYVVKPPCYCEFTGILTSYQQNVPYFQTGFWEVNTLKNYRRDIPKLQTGSLSSARWVELNKDNQYFGEGKSGRWRRFSEYESYAKTVDTNLSIMAEMIVNKIIPAFKVIDSINPNEKLIISLDAWSDRRPVKRGWYIGNEVKYTEGVLNEAGATYNIDYQYVNVKDKSSLNMNNDTLSRLRAFYGYKELLNKLLDTAKFGRGFYDYYKANLTLLPDNEALNELNLSKNSFNAKIDELIQNSKIIILAKGNYFDTTNYKIPQYIRDVDSSLFMLDTIRRIDLRINTLYNHNGKLIKSPCCNPNLPCVEYEAILNERKLDPAINEKRNK